MQWLPYSIAATLLIGASLSLYKLPTFKGYSSLVSTFWSNTFAAAAVLLALVIVAPEKLSSFADVSWYAMLWGALFAINMITLKMLLRDVESVAAYPVSTSIGTIITVLIGITLLSEHVSLVQALGIATILVSVYLFTRKGGTFPSHGRSYLLLFGAVASSTASKYVQKLGAIHEPVERFMSWQYVGAALFAFLAIVAVERSSLKVVAHSRQMLGGALLIGLFTAAGGFAIFKALSMGPLSGVFAIHPAYTFVAAIVGWLLFKEKLTTKKILLALLSVVGVILIRIG